MNRLNHHTCVFVAIRIINEHVRAFGLWGSCFFTSQRHHAFKGIPSDSSPLVADKQTNKQTNKLPEPSQRSRNNTESIVRACGVQGQLERRSADLGAELRRVPAWLRTTRGAASAGFLTYCTFRATPPTRPDATISEKYQTRLSWLCIKGSKTDYCSVWRAGPECLFFCS